MAQDHSTFRKGLWHTLARTEAEVVLPKTTGSTFHGNALANTLHSGNVFTFDNPKVW